ncbi:MAG: patatin-like phospholipase family protein, partial [Hymenobacteraceae bacterium]|nr:patatin-like phospholipase family protein [Hymenobacteraceae bacterium]
MNLGLALSGGGARGIAHLGVLQALEELDMKPDMLSGVSSGAIFGTFYAAGFSPTEILKMLQEVNVLGLMRPAFSRFGLMNMREVEKLYLRLLGDMTFEDLKLPLVISTVDLNKAEVVRFSSGPLIKPLVASTTLPVLYHPVQYEERMLIDGGMLNNLPVECLLNPCLTTIGVHTNPINREQPVTNIRSVIERTFQIIVGNNVKHSCQYCSLLLEPPLLSQYNLFAFAKADEIFKIGYDFTMANARNLLDLKETWKQASGAVFL